MNPSKRDFLKKMTALGAGSSLLPLSGLANAVGHSEEQTGKPERFTVGLFQTTDVHCQLHPHDELFWENGKTVFRKTGGYAEMAAFLEKERAKYQHSFLVDTGDMFQGSMLSVKTEGEAFVPILNALDYDLYLPGNWEVIYYKPALQSLMGSLYAPKVCANMYHDLGNGEKGELIFPPYYIWHVNGVKIGFLGYNDHLVPQRQSPNYSKGIIFTKPEYNLKHYVDVLRNQEKCAFVVVLSHTGLSQEIHLANLPECEGVDYIFGADTHERVRVPIQCKYAKVVQPGAFGSFVGKLELTFESGKVVGERYSLLEVDANKTKPSKEMRDLVQQAEAPFLSEINEVVGHSTIPLYRYFVIENPIDTLVLDALDWQLPNIDIILSNGFRFCPPRATPDGTGNIPITKGFIFDMLPVDSVVRTGEVTGAQIKTWLERELNNVFAEDASKRFGGWVTKFKGMEVEFYAYGEEGNRVKSITVGGQAISDDKVYSIAACERDGDPADMVCRMRNVKNTQNTSYTLHQVMVNYLKANSPVTPRPRGAAKALDAPATLLTQVRGVDYEFR